jgi:hypothetical protein
MLLSWFDPTPAGISLCLQNDDGKVEDAGFVSWDELNDVCFSLVLHHHGLEPFEDTGLLSIGEHIQATCRPADNG